MQKKGTEMQLGLSTMENTMKETQVPINNRQGYEDAIFTYLSIIYHTHTMVKSSFSRVRVGNLQLAPISEVASQNGILGTLKNKILPECLMEAFLYQVVKLLKYNLMRICASGMGTQTRVGTCLLDLTGQSWAVLFFFWH